jgi:hypothetical protein
MSCNCGCLDCSSHTHATKKTVEEVLTEELKWLITPKAIDIILKRIKEECYV